MQEPATGLPLSDKLSSKFYNLNGIDLVECCVCWGTSQLTTARMDLHEIIFSRGDIQGLDDTALLWIMDRHNCGYVHQDKCHKLGEGGEGRRRAIQHLILQEGYTNIKVWIQKTCDKYPDLLSLKPMSDLEEAYKVMLSWMWTTQASVDWRLRCAIRQSGKP
jgi:hypothetical protein